MESKTTHDDNREFVHRAIEAAIRIGLLAGLAWWCAAIVRPFIMPVLWAVIFAVALYPIFARLKRMLGGRGGPAAAILTVIALAVLLAPILVLTTSMIDSVQKVGHGIEDGTLEVPPPPDGVEEWPVVGESLAQLWSDASRNLQDFMARHREQLKPVWSFVVAQAAGAGGATLVFAIAILVAGLLMARADRAVDVAVAVASRLAGEQGAAMVTVAGDTIRSVVQGVLGVAVIQSLLAGLGMLVVGVPGAGLWAGLVLLLAIMQLPPILVLGPAMVWVFSSSSTVTAVVFLVYGLIVSGSDAVLKPLLLGRGMTIPMPVILIGAIGGMMYSGIVGLFIGAVVLALAYQLVERWLKSDGGGGGSADEDLASAPEG